MVKAGLFDSKDEAIAHSHEWLRQEAEKLEAIRAAIKESEEQSARGETHTLDADETVERLRKRNAERNTDTSI